MGGLTGKPGTRAKTSGLFLWVGSLESRARGPKRVAKPRVNGARAPRGEAAR